MQYSIRSSCLEVFCDKDVLKNSQGKTCVGSLFNKVAIFRTVTLLITNSDTVVFQ